MSVCYRDFLDYACQAIESDESSEIKLRNACSRAYYAAYHMASECADNLSMPYVEISNGGDHARLFARFEKHGHRAKVVASQLRKLKRKRELCDYKLDVLIDLDYTKLVVGSAERLIEDILHIS